MRARNIKPGFFENEDLAELLPQTRLLFIGLWMLADREGRLENRPRRIKAQIFPYEDADVPTMLAGLTSAGFVQVYGDQGEYLHLPTFVEHQNIHQHERASTLPDPDNTRHADTCRDMSVDVAKCRPESLNPESLNPESLNPESVSAPKNGARLPESWMLPDEAAKWTARELNWSQDRIAETEARFRDYWIAVPGAKGRKRDWIATWRNWCRRDLDSGGKPRRDESAFDQMERMKREGKIT